MAALYYHRFINKIRSLLSILLTSYDPYGDKLLEDFCLNPYYPFICTQPFTFEYKYRRWSTIFLLFILQILLFIIALYTVSQFHRNEYWINHSEFLLLFLFGLFTVFLCLNIIENFKQRRIVLSPLDFHVSIYVNDILTQQTSIDRAYVCLQQIQSYDILLYHLVFVVEDMDFISITDYFSYQQQLRPIGKCLAQNLYLSYIESANWNGIFPKYKKLKNYIQKQTVNQAEHISTIPTNNIPRKRSHQSSVYDLV